MSNRRFEVFEYRQVLARMRLGDSDRDIAGAHLMVVAVPFGHFLAALTQNLL